MKTFFVLGGLGLMVFVWERSYAQNLVPNPSFEEYTSCPIDHREIENVYSWFKPTEQQADYFNSCYSGIPYPGVDVPENDFGFQNAHYGNAYCGIAPYYVFNNRVYLECHLNNSLDSGKAYYISFFLSLAEKSKNAIGSIGALFSSDSIFEFTYYALNHSPQFLHPIDSIISDTLNWTKVSGSFTAQGGEKFMTIGNFLDNADTPADTFANNSSISGAYYYIDDICVSSDSSICLVTGIITVNSLSTFSVSPNPFTTSTTITLINYTAPLNVHLFDKLGRKTPLQYYTTQLGNGITLTIDRGELLSGMYLLSIASGEKREVVKLMVD